MKILLSHNEVQVIAERALKEKGLRVKPGSFAVVSHIEGQYDDAREIFDGFSVELED